MQVGTLVRTNDSYWAKPRTLGIIVGSKIWDSPPYKGKLTFLVQFVDDDKSTWWTKDNLEVICK